MEDSYIISTIIGPIKIKEKDGRITSLRLPRKRITNNDFRDCHHFLNQYFTGKKVKFNLPLDINKGTSFQQKVWRYLMDIPYGTIVTYKDIARALGLGKAYRAVGQACRRNPIPILIPCHRVIASNGSLGGYSSGTSWKGFLLELEKRRRK